LEVLIVQENDLFNLNTNIQKFSYKNVKDAKDLRELKVQASREQRLKTLEKLVKVNQLRKNIEDYKDSK